MKHTQKHRYYSFCADCKRPFIFVDCKTQKKWRILSKYPLCMECFNKRRLDPEFTQWLAAKLYANKNFNHNRTDSTIKRKPAKKKDNDTDAIIASRHK